MRLAPAAWIALALIAVSAIGMWVVKRSHPVGDPWKAGAGGWGVPAAVAERHALIEAEAHRLAAHPWAGEYYNGDGLGMNVELAIAPAAGVAIAAYGDTGMYAANAGSLIVQADGNLVFHFDLPDLPKTRTGQFPDALHPVRWGQRRYLIPESELVDFANALNRGEEPRTTSNGWFLMAVGDETRQVAGMPDLPDNFQALVRREPLASKVVGVEALPPARKNAMYCERRYRLTMDRGLDDGLVVGAALDASPAMASDTHYRSSSVVESTAHSAIDEMSFIDYGCAHPPVVPAIGRLLTTGSYDPAAAARRIAEAAAR